MGYNLYLFCSVCQERAFAFRGREASAIQEFAKNHVGHPKEVAVDNGFAETWWLEDERFDTTEEEA